MKRPFCVIKALFFLYYHWLGRRRCRFQLLVCEKFRVNSVAALSVFPRYSGFSLMASSLTESHFGVWVLCPVFRTAF